MTLTELRYLVNLDKERHFGRAAERSFVSQPTLSVAVKKLEDELGVMLFERNRGEARPTPVGERIIAQARKVLAEAGRVEDMAREGRDELSGPLRLGAIYTVGPYLLPGLVPMMRERAPMMRGRTSGGFARGGFGGARGGFARGGGGRLRARRRARSDARRLTGLSARPCGWF